MPNVTLTITISEAEAVRVEQGLCEFGELAISAANAKIVVREWIKRTVKKQEEERKAREAREAVTPVEGVT